MGIGKYLEDAIRNIYGAARVFNKSIFTAYDTWVGSMAVVTNTFSAWAIPPAPGSASDIGYSELVFDASKNVPTALENRPASISAFLGIKY
jgi:hypothetical protein